MSLNVLEEMVIVLGFNPNTEGLDKAKVKAIEGAKEMREKWNSAAASVTKAFTRMAVGATALSAALTKVVFDTANMANEIDKSAKAAGIAASSYQTLAFAQEQLGKNATKLGPAMRMFQVNLAMAGRDGKSKPAQAFKELGLSIQELRDLQPEQIIGKIGDSLKGFTERGQISILADLIGTDNAGELKELFSAGTTGIAGFSSELDKLGRMSDEQVAAGASFSDSWGKLSITLKDVRNIIGGALMPDLEQLIQTTTEWITKNKDLIRVEVAKWAEKIVSVAKTLLEKGKSLIEFFGSWRGKATLVTYAIIALIPKMLQLANAIRAVVLVAASHPLVATFIAAFSLGKILTEWQAFHNVVGAVADKLNISKDTRAAEAHTDKANRDLMTPEERSAIENLETWNAKHGAGPRGARELRKLEHETAQKVFARQGGSPQENADRSRAKAAFDDAVASAPGFLKGVVDRWTPKNQGGSEEKKDRETKPTGGKKEKKLDTSRAQSLFGQVARGLQERHGITNLAYERAMEAAQSSLNQGDIPEVARNAALSVLGSSVGKDFTTKKMGSFMDQMLSSTFDDENLPDIKMGEVARGAEPQVLVSNITNTFNFDNDFQIDGAGDPREVGSAVVEAFNLHFQQKISESTNSVKVRMMR